MLGELLEHVFQVRVILKDSSVHAAKGFRDVNISNVNRNNWKMSFKSTLLIQAEVIVEPQTKTPFPSYGQE